MENVDFDRAYDFIRERILKGEFPCGAALRADLLAAKIGVSRTPVRDALRQLESDGLVTIRARVGASVRTMDLKEYSDMTGLRLSLEIFAAGLAALHRTPEDLEEMRAASEALREQTERSIAVGDIQSVRADIMRVDTRFHLAILVASRNDLIRKEIVRLHLINRVMAGSAFPQPYRPVPSSKKEREALWRATVNEHKEIYESIEEGDVAAARAAMERHLAEDVESTLRRMARIGSGQGRPDER